MTKACGGDSDDRADDGDDQGKFDESETTPCTHTPNMLFSEVEVTLHASVGGKVVSDILHRRHKRANADKSVLHVIADWRLLIERVSSGSEDCNRTGN